MQQTVRCAPAVLVNIMNGLTEPQKNAIDGAGFGAVLKYRAIEIKRFLCVQIARSFQPETGEFLIGTTRVRMTLDDVTHVLGLPSKEKNYMDHQKYTYQNYSRTTSGKAETIFTSACSSGSYTTGCLVILSKR